MGNSKKNNRGDRQMHRATCTDCGKNCEVPFKPTGDKPIYCSDCFSKGERGGGGKGGGRGRRNEKRGQQEMHRATCTDCGKNCEVPFRPSGNKPVYCSDCFGQGERSSRGPGKPHQSNKENNKKHDEINAKLDKILLLLQNSDTVKKTVKKKAVVKKVPVKKAVKKKTPVKKTVKKKAPAKKKAK